VIVAERSGVFSGLYRASKVLFLPHPGGVIALDSDIPVPLLQKRLGFKRSLGDVAVFSALQRRGILASANAGAMPWDCFSFDWSQTLPSGIDSSDSQQHQRAA